jgi:N-acetylglucosaminyldiphosphoundecaprenol N-acetyl-beta-D-mannosaminyltransferase
MTVTIPVNTVELLGYRIFADDLAKIFPAKEKIVVSTINAFSYAIAKSDKDFRFALKNSDILLPDGVSFVLANSIINNHRLRKISGTTLFYHIAEELQKSGGRIFFLGSTDTTLELIRRKLKTNYPKIDCGYFSPPYKKTFDETDTAVMIEKINSFHPDVVFIGMTAPKQEKWAAGNKMRIHAKMICSIGAVFDFYAGTVKPPNKFLVSVGLEWLSRLMNDPAKMWKRYLKFPTSRFLLDIILAKTGIKKNRVEQEERN